MYYIYLHICLDSRIPFYIGKGKDKRSNSKSSRNKFWKNVQQKHNYDILILEDNLDEEESLVREIYWINRIGRRDLNKGTLVNLTNGGESTYGYKHSEESKRKMSQSRKGIPTSDLQKEIVGMRYKNKFGKDHNRSKKVICIETGIIYESQLEAQRNLNLSNGSVSWSIKHKKPIYGMHFEIKK